MNKIESPYNRAWLIRSLLVFLAIVIAMNVAGGLGFLLIFPCVLIGFGKNKTVLLLWCLLTTVMLTIGNHALMPKDNNFYILNRIVYLLIGGVMICQLVSARSVKTIRPILMIFPYLAYAALVSAVGFMPIISYLKLVFFTITFLSFYSVVTVSQQSAIGIRELRSIVLCFACVIIVGSVILIPFPAISHMSVQTFFELHGYLPKGALFMGVTWQSQVLGPLVAMFSSILLADLLFSIRRWDLLYVILLVLSPILIYKTGSRTAMGTYVAGLFFVLFVFMCAHGVGGRWKNRVLTALTVLGLLGGCVTMATPQIRESALQFIFKTRGKELVEGQQTFENFTSSRKGPYYRSLKNFQDSPIIGNGFQVSEMQKGMKVRNWKQLLSAPVEKGFWIIGVLEEGGILGLILICIFWIGSLTLLLKRKAYIGASGLFVLLVSNFGEFTVFSVSGAGGILWAVIFSGLALDAFLIRQTRLELFMQRQSIAYRQSMSFQATQKLG